MNAVILLTGATGFLGTYIARTLLTASPHHFIVLVRATDPISAKRRLTRLWWDWPELVQALETRVEILCGEITLPGFGLESQLYQNLLSRVTHIIHAAADVRLQASLTELRQTNVHGTQNLLDFARAIHQHHSLARFVHISTAYVAGGRNGVVKEADLTATYSFSSGYELSKFEAEQLVQQAKADLPICILRPGMIVGDQSTGAIKTFNTLYFPLRLYLSGKIRWIPTRSTQRVNLIPVDYVAACAVKATFHPDAIGLNFHITAATESLPTVNEIIQSVRDWAAMHLQIKLPRPWFWSLPLPRHWYQVNPQRGPQKSSDWQSWFSLLPYFQHAPEFDRKNSDHILGRYCLNWQELLPRLLEYAVSKNFLHQTERTVHEQILFRLQSRRRPVTFHDFIEGQMITRTSAEIRGEMLCATAALHTFNIQAGDRVAIVGWNSTRYLVLDVAIGLIGAVSVPLYYTSPPQELRAIIEASGARVVLVGAQHLLSQTETFAPNLPVISFCQQAPATTTSVHIITWEAFLARGVNPPEKLTAPVTPRNMATLRYSSGTTGQPKGVIFNHSHLQWMAVTIAALFPWRARNRHAAYLSFLPMNHVVEGILGTYSPYYIPAAIDLCFLEDFKQLPATLPQVKPTIFFSVPRLYEKVWENFSNHRLGDFYLRHAADFWGRWLRPLLRRSVLKRAGLNACAQLIVGSAPASDALLSAFQQLGIEIHNAYGLTEAPLVTLNRSGANRIGTVGPPLPHTQIRIANDGEVLVQGPQVAVGYFDANTVMPVQANWLQTGDLGYLTENGDLVVTGRKKELIKTAYGKYVQPGKIETQLREVPGIVNALVIGEGKPYCMALLWVQGKNEAVLNDVQIDTAIQKINTTLAPPEQVRRWAILVDDLSIEGGDLTANFKLKRDAVVHRLEPIIAALYAASVHTPSVLHWGQVS